MGDYDFHVHSLHDLAVNQIIESMNANTLEYVLKFIHPEISLQILWKVLQLYNNDKYFEYNHTVINTQLIQFIHSASRGETLHNLDYILTYSQFMKNCIDDEYFADRQQTKCVDRFNFSVHFDLELLLNFIEVTNSRGQLFTIFQICVQKRGFKFPKDLSEKWIQIKIDDDNQKIIYFHIKQGLKLGIFLGDAGWLNECAQVLKHTYKIINTKWKCRDRNLQLLIIIQCLTKWLLVLSKVQKFDEAKTVLKRMIHTINMFENMKEKSVCIANAYLTVSEHYYLLMEFDKAWPWAVKAIYELRDKSDDTLKLLVISHAIKISSVLKKLDMAKNLYNQMHTYKKKICKYIHIDILLNEAVYFSHLEQLDASKKNFFIALDCSRTLFGYCNLNTAIVLVDYAYAQYICFDTLPDYNDALLSAQQSTYIMERIDVPRSSMLFMRNERTKALILEKSIPFITHKLVTLQLKKLLHHNAKPFFREQRAIKKRLLRQIEVIHSKVLKQTLNTVGPQAMLTAKSFGYLGNIYQSQNKYKKAERMYLKAIKIKKSILDQNSAEIAISFCDLGSLNLKMSKRLQKAELYLSKSLNILETNYGYQHKEILDDIRGLRTIYKRNDKMKDCYKYNTRLARSSTSREIWLNNVFTAVDEDFIKHGLSLEIIKSILINNSYNY